MFARFSNNTIIMSIRMIMIMIRMVIMIIDPDDINDDDDYHQEGKGPIVRDGGFLVQGSILHPSHPVVVNEKIK